MPQYTANGFTWNYINNGDGTAMIGTNAGSGNATTSGTNAYSIVGMTEYNARPDINKICGRKKGACNVGYNKIVTSSNNPSISNKLRYSQLLRTQRFKTVRTYNVNVPPINNERPLYLFATGQIFTRSVI